MSDWSGKHIPILELIARLSGRAIGVPTFGGSAPSITDHDIAAAVAMSRRTVVRGKDRHAAQDCVRPELLLLYYAGQSNQIPQITRVCAGHTNRDQGQARIARYAAYLAAQVAGGRVIGSDQIKQAAWMIEESEIDLQMQTVKAARWMQEELDAAERGYCRAMRRWVEVAKAA